MELRNFFYPIRKWWWLVLIATLLAGISSIIATQDLPSVYVSRTTLLIGRGAIDPNPTGNAFAMSRQLSDIYADMAQRTPIREAVKEALGLEDLPDYEAVSLRDSQIIEIVVSDTNRKRAQVVADEIARQLIQRSPTSSISDMESRQSFIMEQLDYLEPRIVETQTEIDDAIARLAQLTSAVEISETMALIDALEIKLADLQNNYALLLASSTQGAVNTITVIEPAEFPTSSVGPSRWLIVAVATMLGFVLSSGAAHLIEYLDDTIKLPEDITHLVGAQPLASIGHIKKPDDGNMLVAITNPLSPVAEDFRLLRAGIQSILSEETSKTLLISSPNPMEGKSLIAANLAVVMSRAGHDVVLLDVDFYRPAQQELFGLSYDRSLANVFGDDGSSPNPRITKAFVAKLAQPSDIPRLSVITNHPSAWTSSDFIVSDRFTKLLNALKSSFEYVILDSPAALAFADAIVLSTYVDGVVLIADSGRTQKSQIEEVMRRFSRVGANLLGTVLNNDPSQSHKRTYYYATPFSPEATALTDEDELKIRKSKRPVKKDGDETRQSKTDSSVETKETVATQGTLEDYAVQVPTTEKPGDRNEGFSDNEQLDEREDQPAESSTEEGIENPTSS